MVYCAAASAKNVLLLGQKGQVTPNGLKVKHFILNVFIMVGGSGRRRRQIFIVHRKGWACIL